MAAQAKIRWQLIATVMAAAILIAPIWAVAMPSLPDLPAHLASFYLLAGGIHHLPLSHYYRLDWEFVPNLASEIVVPLLSHITGLLPAAKLFLSAEIALWVLGAAAIQKALFGRLSLAPLMASFFAYNANFFWGFMNYEFAAGLSFVCFAGWIASENWPWARRELAFGFAVTVVYFCHVFAAAVLLLLIGAYECEKLLRARMLFTGRALAKAGEVCLLALPAALAFLFLRPKAADQSHLEFNLLSTWDDRLGGFFEARFDQPGYVVIALLAAFWLVAVWRGWLKIHPLMRMPLIVVFLSVIFAPEWAMGGWGVDLRMPAVLGALAFASGDLRLPVRAAGALAAVAIAGLCLAAAAAGGNWAYYDHQYTEFRKVLARSPRGTRIMAVLDGTAMGDATDQPYWHIAEFAIIDRQGFSSLLFTTAGQHVVRVRPALQPYAAATAQGGSPPDVGELDDLAAGQVDGDKDIRDDFPYLMRFQCHYDQVVVIRSGGRASPAPDVLKLRYRGSFFDLYDTRRDDACGNA